MIAEKKALKIFLWFGLSLAVLVGTTFIIRGANNEVDNKGKRAADFFDADLVVIPKAAEKLAWKFVLADIEKPAYLPSGVYERLRKEPGIDRMTAHVYLGKPASDCCSFIDGPIIAFEEDSDFIITPLVAERRKKGLLAQYEVLEGGSVHDYLGLITDILLLGNNAKISGYLKHTGTNLDNAVFMRAADIAVTPKENLPPGYRPGSVSIVFVRLKDGISSADFTAKAQNIYPGIALLSKSDLHARD